MNRRKRKNIQRLDDLSDPYMAAAALGFGLFLLGLNALSIYLIHRWYPVIAVMGGILVIIAALMFFIWLTRLLLRQLRN